MKILAITAGAANMYCGSCLRDNALAAELISQGHDVQLVPIYTPTLTDETNVSQERVFFGGISVYLEQHSALFRKTPWLLDKLWDSQTALKIVSKRSISVDPRSLGELTVSMLKGETGYQSKEIDKLLHWLKNEDPPDIIDLPNSMLIALAKPIKETLNRPVCCTLQGEDIFLEGLEKKFRDTSLDLIKANVKYVDGFLAVSEYYAKFMSEYLDIPPEKIHVVPLGINLQGYNKRSRTRTDEFVVGYMARVAPEKGLHLLTQAYRKMRSLPNSPRARLEVAGYMAPEHRRYLDGIKKEMDSAGYANEFNYHGVLDRDEKIKFLESLDVLSVPTTYDEPKGMFLLEAMAAGVPVVQPRRGSFTEMIEKTGGGKLVKADDPTAVADGLMDIWEDRELADELSRNGAEGVREHYSAALMASRALEVYSQLVSEHARGVATEAV